MHDFPTDFYGYEMRAVVLGYIRPELDYVSKGALRGQSSDTVLTFIIRAADSGHRDGQTGRHSFARQTRVALGELQEGS